MPKKQNYECIRCGYNTDSKSHMHKHLFLKKTPCPQTKNLIVLTDEIKQHILDNRIYIMPTPVKPAKVTNIITNNNTINNLIVNMDTIEKLTKYTEYKKVKIIDFRDSVDQKVRSRAEKFNTDDLKYLNYSMQLKFIEDISDISVNKTIDDFNIFYESKIKTINVYKDRKWNQMHVTDGIIDIIKTIQDSIWDDYEHYLIRKIENRSTSHLHRQKCKEYLVKYYKFIGCFDVEPYIKSDTFSYDLEDLVEKYIKLYNDTVGEITRIESKNETKKILDIISHNTIHSIKDMNKTVINLFNMDEDFKKMIV